MKAALLCLVFFGSSNLAGCATRANTSAPAGGAVAASGRTSCGGDVVGHWVITSANVSLDVARMRVGCPAMAGSGTGLALSGEATYEADGTYTQVSALAGNIALELPASCISAGPGPTCAELGSMFSAEMFRSASCTPSVGGCACLLTLGSPMTTKGKYALPSTGVLSKTEAGQPRAAMVDYCVDGATMTQSPHPGSEKFISFAIVLEKQ